MIIYMQMRSQKREREREREKKERRKKEKETPPGGYDGMSWSFNPTAPSSTTGTFASRARARVKQIKSN